MGPGEDLLVSRTGGHVTSEVGKEDCVQLPHFQGYILQLRQDTGCPKRGDAVHHGGSENSDRRHQDLADEVMAGQILPGQTTRLNTGRWLEACKTARLPDAGSATSPRRSASRANPPAQEDGMRLAKSCVQVNKSRVGCQYRNGCVPEWVYTGTLQTAIGQSGRQPMDHFGNLQNAA